MTSSLRSILGKFPRVSFAALNTRYYSLSKPIPQKTSASKREVSIAPEILQNERLIQDDINRDVPEFIDIVTSDGIFSEMPEVKTWMQKVLKHNLSTRWDTPLNTVLTYQAFEKPEKITEKCLRQARFVGLCAELVPVCMMILDDILDASPSRDGVTTWHRVPGIGLAAINDALMVYTSACQVLKTHCSQEPYYTDLINLYNEITLKTCMGQCLDISMSKQKEQGFSKFTMEQYMKIATYKAIYISFTLPLSNGLYLANIKDMNVHRLAESVCSKMGILIQIKNDYYDVFGDPSVTGKAGSDIAEAKLSWMAVNALQSCNADQRREFQTCYGSSEENHIERIKTLYRQLNLPEMYRETETAMYNAIVSEIEVLPDNFPTTVFYQLLKIVCDKFVK